MFDRRTDLTETYRDGHPVAPRSMSVLRWLLDIVTEPVVLWVLGLALVAPARWWITRPKLTIDGGGSSTGGGKRVVSLRLANEKRWTFGFQQRSIVILGVQLYDPEILQLLQGNFYFTSQRSEKRYGPITLEPGASAEFVAFVREGNGPYYPAFGTPDLKPTSEDLLHEFRDRRRLFAVLARVGARRYRWFVIEVTSSSGDLAVTTRHARYYHAYDRLALERRWERESRRFLGRPWFGIVGRLRSWRYRASQWIDP